MASPWLPIREVDQLNSDISFKSLKGTRPDPGSRGPCAPCAFHSACTCSVQPITSFNIPYTIYFSQISQSEWVPQSFLLPWHNNIILIDYIWKVRPQHLKRPLSTIRSIPSDPHRSDSNAGTAHSSSIDPHLNLTTEEHFEENAFCKL